MYAPWAAFSATSLYVRAMRVTAAAKVANASALKIPPDVCEIRNPDRPSTTSAKMSCIIRRAIKPVGIWTTWFGIAVLGRIPTEL